MWFKLPIAFAFTTQNTRFFIKEFFSKCDQIRRKHFFGKL